MTPKTTKGAIEKLYRIRQYLNGVAAWGHCLSFEQQMGFSSAIDITYKAQEKVWNS